MGHYKYLLVYGLIVLLSTSCNSFKKTPRSYDVIISNKVDGGYTKQHFRNGWLFIDQFRRKKIVDRKVYLNDVLMYSYPVRQSSLIKSEIKLLSGNDYLVKGITDTLKFENKDLPVMNRSLFTKGGMLSKISDSLYLIKSFGTSERVVFYVSVSANMDEINNSEQFISDSLALPVH